MVTGAALLLVATSRHADPDSNLSILKDASSALCAKDARIKQASRIGTNKRFFNDTPHFITLETGRNNAQLKTISNRRANAHYDALLPVSPSCATPRRRHTALRIHDPID
jgi:hypothetical protein